MESNNKNSQRWVSEIAKAKFPRIVKPKSADKDEPAGPDLSKIPDIIFQKESFGDVDLPGLKIKGLIIGQKITVDKAFTAKWENGPPSIPFSVTVPKNKQIKSIPGGKKTGIPELLKVQIASEDGKRVIEIARFAQMTVPLQKDPKDRIKLCAWILQNQGVDMALRGKKNGKIFETYATKIGTLDAVVVNGQFDEPDGSATFFVKLFGILDKKGKGGVMVYVISDNKLSAIKTPEDLRSKGIGQRIVHSLKFEE